MLRMKRSTLVWIGKRIRRRLPAIGLMVLLQSCSSLLAVWFALGTRGVIDSAAGFDREGFFSACFRLGVLILGVLGCYVATRGLRDRIATDLERDWKKRILHGLLRGDYETVSGYHSAELLNRMNGDVARINEGVLAIVPGVAAMVVRLGAAVAVLGALDAGLTGMMVALGVILIGVTGFMRRRLKDLNKRVAEQDGKVFGYLQESMEKLLLVQAMDVAPEVERRADVLLGDRYRLQRKRRTVSLITGTGMNLLSLGVSFLALVWCAGRMLQGQMSFGALTAVLQLVNQLQSPFMGLSGVVPRYAAVLASAERLMELEAIEQEPEPMEEAPEALYARMEALRGEGIHFSYDRDKLLEDASFVLPKGSFTVVTGPSGIGKSTLLKLLLGVLRPEAGGLYLQSADGNVPLDRRTRRLFAYVPQGNLLFSGSIRENLTITKPDAGDAELAEAIRISAMDDFLSQLPKGLDTILGENAQGLSEGQAQRLSIARAVLSGAPVLLLDECTSALDAAAEERVLGNLRGLKDRTVIAVTHRPAAVELADRKITVENGKLCCDTEF